MSETREIETMRYMEWERAKGSLRAILASHWDWDVSRAEEDVSFEDLRNMVEDFIREFGEKGGMA